MARKIVRIEIGPRTPWIYRKTFVVKDQIKVASNWSSFPPWESLLEDEYFNEEGAVSDMHRPLTFKPLHNFSFRILNLLNKYIITSISSNMAVMDRHRLCGSTGPGQSMKSALWKASSSMLAAIEEMYSASNLHLHFCKEDTSQQLSSQINAWWMVKDSGGKRTTASVYSLYLRLCISGHGIEISERSMLTTLHTFSTDQLFKAYVVSEELSWT